MNRQIKKKLICWSLTSTIIVFQKWCCVYSWNQLMLWLPGTCTISFHSGRLKWTDVSFNAKTKQPVKQIFLNESSVYIQVKIIQRKQWPLLRQPLRINTRSSRNWIERMHWNYWIGVKSNRIYQTLRVNYIPFIDLLYKYFWNWWWCAGQSRSVFAY